MNSESAIELVALHGFLGEPADFNLLRPYFDSEKFYWLCPDYTKIEHLGPNIELKNWGLEFLDWYREIKDETLKVRKAKRYLIGYSQGGRLVLQVLKHNVELFDGYILISANPGIAESQISERIENDSMWAERFLSEELNAVITAWNGQAVFKGSLNEPKRDSDKIDAKLMANCLLSWSLANQENFSNLLARVSRPVLYISGELDKKYSDIGEKIKTIANSNFHFEKIKSAGHRPHLDQPKLVANAIKQFAK